CAPACSAGGGCREGYTCMDPGSGDTHDNVCLPNGTFPGSPCGPDGNDYDTDGDCSGFADSLQSCVGGKCASRCGLQGDAAAGDAECAGIDTRLTCAESAGGVCVFACGANGECPAELSCLLPGAENACLPSGFPGNPCAPDGDDPDTLGDCEQDLNGDEAADMVCVDDGCVLGCSTSGTTAEDDQVCKRLSSLLTCSETAGDVCVRTCAACPSTHTCWEEDRGERVCLPTGSFPGSPCRPDGPDDGTDGDCDQDLNGNSEADMLCIDDVCVVECSTGGTLAEEDAVCASVSDLLTCSERAGDLCVRKCDIGGSFAICPSANSCFAPHAEQECLPHGSFLGSECGADGPDDDREGDCDRHVKGNVELDMVCVDFQCVVDVDCSTGGTLAEEDALCESISELLTCSETGGDRCVLKCDGGGCAYGRSCFEPGVSGENACLPNGTFPGSGCAGNVSCSSIGPLAMICTGDTLCAIDCSSGWTSADKDALCARAGADFRQDLTCFEGEQDLCVVQCDASDGSCPAGYSCLDPGGENACVRDGSVPGSACQAPNQWCSWLYPPIGDPIQMQCVGGQCAITCDPLAGTGPCAIGCGIGGNPAADDALCVGVNPALTCSESAGDLCVTACGAGGACPTGYSCLGAGVENACLPNGFPGNPCRPDGPDDGSEGDCDEDMLCVDGVCITSCSTGGTSDEEEAVCARLSPLLTCSETAGDQCVLKCDRGRACPATYACQDPGNNIFSDENACLSTGSFPGSPCRPDGLDAGTDGDCDQDLNGNAEADMLCVDDMCIVECSTGGTLAEEDAVCASVDELLTCSETAGDVCVPRCDEFGLCPYPTTCFAPGSGTENACLRLPN
ncbi:MAG TPA: hypothetical protein VK509_25130, partial [Polyangiales bacterium]|nr:hypothetical protein [Polyangiales bacterium]